jgi:drug/metabolite transporter (DMT)-like permease
VTRERLTSFAMLVALAVFWGSAFAMIELAIRTVTPQLVVFSRLALGSLIMLAVLRVRGIALPRLWPKPDPVWAWLIALGILGNALPFLLVANAQKSVDSSFSAIITGTLPLITGVAAHFMFVSERLSLRAGLGLLIGLCGILLLVAPEMMEEGLAFNWGKVLVVLSLFSYAANNITARASPKLASEVTATGSILCAAILMAPLGLPRLGELASLSWQSGLGLIGLAIIPTAMAAFLYMALIRREGARFTALTNYAIPPVGVVLGLLLGETITLWALLAMGCIILGVVLGSDRKP